MYLQLVPAVRNSIAINSESIALIYSRLVDKIPLKKYRTIFIAERGEHGTEGVLLEKGTATVVVNMPAPAYFNELSTFDRNVFRLNFIHEGFLKLVEKDPVIAVSTLNQIRDEIVKNNFRYEFELKSWPTRDKTYIAKLLIEPTETTSIFNLTICNGKSEICRKTIYHGSSLNHYIKELFSKGKWVGSREFHLTGAYKEMEIVLRVSNCNLFFLNNTNFEKPPYFELNRSDISAQEKEKAYADWERSLPPEVEIIKKSLDESWGDKI